MGAQAQDRGIRAVCRRVCCPDADESLRGGFKHQLGDVSVLAEDESDPEPDALVVRGLHRLAGPDIARLAVQISLPARHRPGDRRNVSLQISRGSDGKDSIRICVLYRSESLLHRRFRLRWHHFIARQAEISCSRVAVLLVFFFFFLSFF